jgi:hypothetical protein
MFRVNPFVGINQRFREFRLRLSEISPAILRKNLCSD